MTRRIALLGGTFDPVHRGHLTIAEQVAEATEAEEAWLIPARQPPHRGPAHASPEDRWALLEAAVSARPHVRALDVEMRRDGPSYTIDTLAELQNANPGTDFRLILGADVAPAIRTWHRATELLRSAEFVIVNRTGTPDLTVTDVRAWGFDPDHTVLLRVRSPLITATEVRNRLASGAPTSDLLSDEVLRVISERRLYQVP